jgi:hypothetical protein
MSHMSLGGFFRGRRNSAKLPAAPSIVIRSDRRVVCEEQARARIEEDAPATPERIVLTVAPATSSVPRAALPVLSLACGAVPAERPRETTLSESIQGEPGTLAGTAPDDDLSHTDMVPGSPPQIARGARGE